MPVLGMAASFYYGVPISSRRLLPVLSDRRISSMEHKQALLDLLSDGRFHSGEQLGDTLGIGRSAVWKHLRALAQKGIEIHAVRGKGYRLDGQLELLSREKIFSLLPLSARRHISGLEIHPAIASTNRFLLDKLAHDHSSAYVCLAESQWEGRGRRGRFWVSPYASNLYLSLSWRFLEMPAAFTALGLAVGVALVRALAILGLQGVRLKWPNDVFWGAGKLAGILLEMSGESGGSCNVVIGIGLNIRMPAQAAGQIGQPWCDLEQALGRSVSRNQVCALVLQQLLDVLCQFQQQGFAPFIEEWRRHDATYGKEVTIVVSGRHFSGTAVGIDNNGACLLRYQDQLHRFMAGDVTLRRAP